MFLDIDVSWKSVLEGEFEKSYFQQLKSFVETDQEMHVIYPPQHLIFSAFRFCPFDKVKAVIIGQDPYHGEGQANGLCFSVNDGVKCPPSLKNIFKELKSDIGKEIPANGNLEHWAKQGVLLLNATLTVRAGTPGSHQKKGWEVFTDTVIKKVSSEKENVVFFLWGAYAHSKEAMIDAEKHLALKAAHPSPFSAHRGFLGCKHFSKANEYLKSVGKEAIEW
ncbi:uracil-DNA glycosylase [Cytophagaceae bacterium ABcell3]|nr:uracil-DNA glycosylase [Cytophagaceae bacterium ABcell3]